MIYVVVDRETISSVSSSVGFTSSKLTVQVDYAKIQAIDGDIRITIDGSTPSTSLGFRLLQDAQVEVWGGDALRDFRCIDDGGTAKLEVIYMGSGNA